MSVAAIIAPYRVSRWRPLAMAMAAGAIYAQLGSQVTAFDRLLGAVAAVAAMSAFAIDDPAAVTVASTPPSLLVRRTSRVLVVAVAIAAWWVIIAATTEARFGPVPVGAVSIQFVGLVAVALAVAAIAARADLTERDGLAGATACMIVHGLTLAPLPSWSPAPRGPGTPGTATRWLVVTAISVAVFLWASRDPASRRWLRPKPARGQEPANARQHDECTMTG